MFRYAGIMAVTAIALFASSSAAADENQDAIVAVAKVRPEQSWLAVDGPNDDGLFSARIDVSDLHLSMPDEQAVMYKRVKTGVSRLCDRIMYDPSAPDGIAQPEAVERRCRTNIYGSAEPQMQAVVAAADRGERVALATIGVSASMAP